MRSERRWAWRSSPRSVPRARPVPLATSTCSGPAPPSRPGSLSSRHSPCRRHARCPALKWQCIEGVSDPMPAQATDPRRETAERNVQAILDAAEELLEQRQAVTIVAVAKQAGVSRVTVYAHFQTWEALLEAV